MKTKKVGSTGRFGARYGLRIRKQVLDIERNQRQKQKCPFCLKFTVKRLSKGIWECGHCSIKFAGRAYEPGITGRPMLDVQTSQLFVAETAKEVKAPKLKSVHKEEVKENV
ncbi:MAG TPA: 50S ribosomal protein L37ae [Nanoarchaeota archaeon]|nr:50S ribosomal protein L37ae [Nanoarchaeota archaeon]